MPATESALTKSIRVMAVNRGAYINKNVGGPNSQGRPDLEGCYRGFHFLWEIKLPKNKKGATESQKSHIRRAREAGSQAVIIRSRLQAEKALDQLDRRAEQRRKR